MSEDDLYSQIQKLRSIRRAHTLVLVVIVLAGVFLNSYLEEIFDPSKSLWSSALAIGVLLLPAMLAYALFEWRETKFFPRCPECGKSFRRESEFVDLAFSKKCSNCHAQVLDI